MLVQVSVGGLSGRNIGPIFCDNVDRKLGSDYRCTHRLKMLEENNWLIMS